MLAFITGLLILVAGTHAQHGGHGHTGGNVPDPDEIDAAIVNIELHYNDKLCLELLLVDCVKHVTQGDEMVCGDNGVTYDNHCKFTHAMCEYLHADTPLMLANHGVCMSTTAAPMTTTTTIGGVAVTITAASATTKAPSGSGSTAAPAAGTTTAAPAMTTTTTAMPATTTDPLASILQGVFCQNAATISCTDGFQILCGTDGQLYPNQCELSKEKCQNPSLTIEPDQSKCALP